MRHGDPCQAMSCHDMAGARLLPAPRAGARRLAGRLPNLLRRLALWAARASERDELAALSDDALKDMGLSRYDVLHEARKPFWRD